MQSFFVSSTFRDMQGERDALHRSVMPRVRRLAKDSRKLRSRLLGTEDFNAVDLDLFDQFLEKLRKSNNEG